MFLQHRHAVHRKQRLDFLVMEWQHAQRTPKVLQLAFLNTAARPDHHEHLSSLLLTSCEAATSYHIITATGGTTASTLTCCKKGAGSEDVLSCQVPVIIPAPQADSWLAHDGDLCRFNSPPY